MSGKWKIAFVLFGLVCNMGSLSQEGCLGYVELGSTILNNMKTTMGADNTTVTVGEPVTITATTTGGYPPYLYGWEIPDLLQAININNTLTYVFDAPGLYLVNVDVWDSQGNTDYGGIFITVLESPDNGDDSDDSDDNGSTAQVTITGPDALAGAEIGTYSASASGIGSTSVTFTWSLLGTGATLGSTIGSQTTVTGKAGTVTLVVEARDSEIDNIIASNQLAISISTQITIDSVSYSTSVVANGPRESMSISWSGNPTFPVTVYKGFKDGGCPEGWECSNRSWTVSTEQNPIVIDESHYCWSDGTLDLPGSFDSELYLIDANAVQSNHYDASYSCVAE